VKPSFRHLLAAFSLIGVASVWSCGSSPGDADANGAGAPGSSGFGSSGASGDGSQGGGSPEVCDGTDNDGNGIIDDVDVGNDGICDCLRIATLGEPGKWGEGDVFATWLSTRSESGATDLAGQVLTKELLEGFQVIVAQDLSALGRTYAAAEIAALDAWVRAGGGLLTLIGYGDPPERANANALLGSFGMAYGAEQILQKNGGATVPITGWVDHPATQGVSRVGVDNGYPVEGSGVTLATEQGHVMLKAQEVEEGHVLVWGDEWITYNSEWKDHPDYQVELLWVSMIKWLTPRNVCQVPIPPDIR
jgi:hypothetical protein